MEVDGGEQKRNRRFHLLQWALGAPWSPWGQCNDVVREVRRFLYRVPHVLPTIPKYTTGAGQGLCSSSVPCGEQRVAEGNVARNLEISSGRQGRT